MSSKSPISKPTAHTNRPLTATQRREKQQQMVKRQGRLRTIGLVVVILITWGLDQLFLYSGLMITKGVSLGASLNWIAQTVFVWFVFRSQSARVSRHIASRMYIGQLVKWLIIIIGFMFIYTAFQPIAAGAVIIGFILLQLLHFIIIWQMD